MELIRANPFIRFADKLRFVSQRGPSVTYDSRLLYTLGGAADMEVDGVCFRATPGSLVLFQSGTPYVIRPDDYVEMLVFDFDLTQDYRNLSTFIPTCTPAGFRAGLAHPPVRFSDAPLFDRPILLEDVAFLEPALYEIVTEFREKRLLYRGKVSTLFHGVLFELVRHSAADGKEDALIHRLTRYIRKNLSAPLTNEALGACFNYNPNYLNRLVLRHTGKTLHQYVMKQRIAAALRLIRTTDQPLNEIALSLGFNSPSHFSACFRKETGLSPSRFREK